MALPSLDDTIAAIATAPGAGAIGIVRISGPDALAVAAALFRPATGGNAIELRDRTATFGRIVDGTTPVDDALLLPFRAPRSYTGQDVVELQLHGGPAVLRTALELALRHGARAAGPGEFTLRAVVHGKLDLARAESVAAMIEARSDAARRQASVGLAGGLGRALAAAQRDLTAAYAHLVAALDYPEEGVPEADVAAHVARARERLARLLATARAGRFAAHGARLALVGRPNAGKSSLLNALLGYERALVGAAPGTTRDYLEALLELGRVSVTAIDTAGLRATEDEVEAGGVALARSLADAADVVVALVDGGRALDDDDRQLLADLDPARTVWVASKADQPAAWPDDALGVAVVRVSSLDGHGLDELKRRLEERLLGDAAGEEAWVTSERHADALRDAIAALDRVPTAPHDLQGLDLETALRALDRITGRGDVVEATLDEVFARFCVGK
ncbi:MAG: tRNA uridine-5-carboxymethylaminomethyl(34) synthesis GTPase MnmE [Trueperaceae bacterium]|nr:tRNA uridine-5-carboxymethylaminomethyl(34) synthesis GTPase MnmE [Trueperaceae bacterium]